MSCADSMASSDATPKISSVIKDPATADSMTGIKTWTLYSRSTTSITNTIAASGVLKEAAIAAAIPQAASVRNAFLGASTWKPSQVDAAAPK